MRVVSANAAGHRRADEILLDAEIHHGRHRGLQHARHHVRRHDRLADHRLAAAARPERSGEVGVRCEASGEIRSACVSLHSGSCNTCNSGLA